jgi:hypothetical protein
MSNDFQQGNPNNPYAPQIDAGAPPPFNPSKIQIPAISMIVLGGLSILTTAWGVVSALITTPPTDFPPDTPEFVIQMSQYTTGPVPAAINAFCMLLALVMLVGGIQMLRVKSRGLATAGAIVSIMNIGSCCCVAGIAIGVWSLIVLQAPEVKQAFAANEGR